MGRRITSQTTDKFNRQPIKTLAMITKQPTLETNIAVRVRSRSTQTGRLVVDGELFNEEL